MTKGNYLCNYVSMQYKQNCLVIHVHVLESKFISLEMIKEKYNL